MWWIIGGIVVFIGLCAWAACAVGGAADDRDQNVLLPADDYDY